MPQCHISWESYKKNICSGFSHLQQSEEFVDMTLAAEGHLVKVHKSLLALASPYIKEMLQTAPCPHPVLFLNSVSHEVLCYILEYIYTGEVHVPTVKMPEFTKAAQALHIVGVNNMKPWYSKKKRVSVDRIKVPKRNTTTEIIQSTNVNSNADIQVLEVFTNDVENTNDLPNNDVENSNDLPNNDVENTNDIPNNDVDNNIAPNNVNYEEPVTNLNDCDVEMANPIEQNNTNHLGNDVDVNDYSIQANHDEINIINVNQPTAEQPRQIYHIDVQLPDQMNEPPRITINPGIIEHQAAPQTLVESQPDNTKDDSINVKDFGASPLFTISTRGSLQMIFNRFMYNVHHCSNRGGRKRRWRCIDYRLKNCKAYIDTLDEDIINRKCIHSHALHDEKIFKKGCQRQVFTSISKAIEELDRVGGADYEGEESSPCLAINCPSCNKSSFS